MRLPLCLAIRSLSRNADDPARSGGVAALQRPIEPATTVARTRSQFSLAARDERRHRIAVGGCGEATGLGELLHRDRLLPGQVGGVAQQRLHHRRHVLRQRLDPLAPLTRSRQQLGVRMHRVGEPDLGSLASRQVPAAGEQLEGALVAEPAREQPARADLGQQPDSPNAGTSRARSETRIRSQARANARPTPAAAPFTAATNALSVRVIRRAICPNSMRIQRHSSGAPPPESNIGWAVSRIRRRSPPAEKAGSAPVRMIARSDSSAASSVSASRSRMVSSALSGLSLSGSFIVTSACVSRRSTRTNSVAASLAAATASAYVRAIVSLLS